MKELNEEVNAMGTKVHKLHTEQTVLKSDGETTKQQNNELREKLVCCLCLNLFHYRTIF